MSKVIPEGARHYPSAVAEFDPDNNAVTLNDGQKLTYDFLVVALGLQTKLDAFPGLREALDDPDSPVTTNYLPEYVTKTFPLIQGLKKGNAVFTFPQTVVKCAGAPQKVMWLAESQWRKNGVRQDIDISFYTPTPAIFSAPKYAASLMKQAKARNVSVNLKHAMKKLDAKRRVVTFEELESKKTFEKPCAVDFFFFFFFLCVFR
jgi:NADPH-dependent 2,4-dienoyl-CoA reductase/sulfur reductase-like enzyme